MSTIITEADLLWAVGKSEFFDVARKYVRNINTVNTVYKVYYDPTNPSQLNMAKSVREFNRLYSLRGTVIVAITFQADCGLFIMKQMLVTRLLMSYADDSRIVNCLTAMVVKDPLNYVNLPIYYSVFDENERRIERIISATNDSLKEPHHRLGVYAQQRSFYDDAISKFYTLSDVPNDVWKFVPLIHDCYSEMFYWFYCNPDRPKSLGTVWTELFSKSQHAIEQRVHDWIDAIALFLGCGTFACTEMPDEEWNMLVNLLINHGRMEVTQMAIFGKSNSHRMIDYMSHPIYPKVYYAAANALTE